MASVDVELTQLLCNETVPSHLKYTALKYILGLSSTESGIRYLLEHDQYLKILFPFAKNEASAELCELAHKCFINVSSTLFGTMALLNSNNIFFECFIKELDNRDSKHIALKCQVLSNATRFHDACVKLASFFHSSPEIFHKLMFHFISNDVEIREKYDYLALFFANLTSCSEGNRLFLNEESPYLRYIVPYTSFVDSEIRRLGAAILLKNVCFEIDHLKFLLEDIDILPHLLHPLIGPEDLDEDEIEKLPLELQYLGEGKARERNPHIRIMLLEALLKICSTMYGRTCLREKGVYFVLRELHKSENVPSVAKACEDVVEILIRDEIDVGIDNMADVNMPEHLANQFENLSVSTCELPSIVL